MSKAKKAADESPLLEVIDTHHDRSVGGVKFGVDLHDNAAFEAARELLLSWSTYPKEDQLRFVRHDVEGVCALLKSWGEDLLRHHAYHAPGLRELLSTLREVNVEAGEVKVGDLLDREYGALDERGVPRRSWPNRVTSIELHPDRTGLGRFMLETTNPFIYPGTGASWQPFQPGERLVVLRPRA